jgi:hypothetical protein
MEPNELTQISDAPKIKRQAPVSIGQLRDPTYMYAALYSAGGRRSTFMSAEYDLSEIGRIEDTESYVSQAFLKKLGLMFKEGYAITGTNPVTVKYIKSRFRQMQQASSISIDSLLRRLGAELIKKSNCFFIKVRNATASGGKERPVVGTAKTLLPVAAYFIAPAETMTYKLDPSLKRIVAWEHAISADKKVDFVPDDIAQFTYNKKEGFIFGTPTLVPVIDDIRALRKIEENIELLIYQHLFPLFHYVVGTETAPAGYTESGEREVDVVKREIRNMPAEGGIVTPERHKIEILGTEGRALRAEGYLTYFKTRVFAGLGISAVDMGEGNTANRATADNMSRNLVDSVKDMQQVIEIMFNDLIIRELLAEASFPDIDPTDEDNMVYLKFREIDIEAGHKKDAHSVDMFTKNAITYPELRMELGRKVIEIPTREEMMQTTLDLSQQYPEWSQTFWKLFDEPKLLIQALDEPWSAASQAAAQNASTAITPANVQTEQQTVEQVKKEEHQRELQKIEKKAAVAPKRPAATSKNSAGEIPLRDLDRSAPRSYISILRNRYDEAEDFVLASIRSGQTDTAWIKAKIRSTFEPAKNELVLQMVGRFYSGYMKHNKNPHQYATALEKLRSNFRVRVDAYVSRLEEDLLHQIDRQVRRGQDLNLSPAEIGDSVKSAFDSLRYRANLIDESELYGAYIRGEAEAFRDLKVEELIVHVSSGACEDCQDYRDQVIKIESFDSYDLPPFHPNCRCGIEIRKGR